MKARLEEVLNSLIKCYLKTKKPVSSSQLKELMNIELSASSIRGYFQELQKKGLIEKPHSSSGSIPSKKAMKLFWSENLKPFKIDLKSLEKKAIDNDIAVIVKVFENQLLKKVYNVENKFIVLEFDNDEVVLKFDKALYNFFKEFEFLDIESLSKLLKNLKLQNESKKLKSLYNYYYINQKVLYNTINSTFLTKQQFADGLQINDNWLSYRFLYKNTKLYDVVLIGDVYANFLALKGGDYE